MSRKKRRADGSLRPSIQRRRQKRTREKRTAWLANFAPKARDRFFNHVLLDQAVYLAPFQKETGLELAEAAELLERTGEERRWRKLRTLDGTVVAIAPPRPKEQAPQ